MKKITLSVLALFASVCLVQAQKLTKESLKQMDMDNHKSIVNQALSYGDLQTAISSMHHILALEGPESTYKDSLTYAYFRIGKFDSSELLSKQLLQKKPNDVGLLEINAISLSRLNANKEAINSFEKLFLSTKNMSHGYQLATLQYSIKRLAEAQATITKTLQCEALEDAYIQFPAGDNQVQKVPLKAAAFNLFGIIAFESKNNTVASQAFDEALNILPEFVVAKENKAALTAEKKD